MISGARTTFQAIGTYWTIQIAEPLRASVWTTLQERMQQRIATFDEAYSRFRPDSLITQISRQAGTYKLPSDGSRLLSFYEQLYHATDGAVTPLIGNTISDAGYDAGYSLQPKQLQAPPTWETVLSYNEHYLTVQRPVLLDVGAAGKGYLVDIVSELIEASGVTAYVVNAGGDIRHRSVKQELEVGLENPHDASEAVGIVHLANKSLCASAGNKRTWGQYHHIINPHTLQSPHDVLATWVIAKDTMTADGLATALFFAHAARLRKDFSFSYALLDSSMNMTYAPDFPAHMFEEAA